MAKISRKEAREKLFELVFETDFNRDASPEVLYSVACELREIPQDGYIKNAYMGIVSRIEMIDTVIGSYSKGWKADRLSRVSRSILRIAIYEILFLPEIPGNVSISQAVELSVKYGEDRAKQFVNGVLSSFYKDVEARGASALISETDACLSAKAEEDADASEKKAEDGAGAETAEAREGSDE